VKNSEYLINISFDKSWAGLTKTQTKPEIKIMEAEASLYDGLTVTAFWHDRGTVTAFELAGAGCEGKNFLMRIVFIIKAFLHSHLARFYNHHDFAVSFFPST